jgi:hypothetical protein
MSHFVTKEKNVCLALALASGVGVTLAAEQAVVHRRTVYRKLADPAFRRLVADLRDELISRALGRLANNMTFASDEMAALLKAENPSVRLRAAQAIVSFGLRLRESVELTERVREIEVELAAKTTAR